MPCYDPPQNQEEADTEQVNNRLSAMLCGVLSAAQQAGTMDKLLSSVDWQAAGVTEVQLRSWWDVHQRKDAARKAWAAKQGVQP